MTIVRGWDDLRGYLGGMWQSVPRRISRSFRDPGVSEYEDRPSPIVRYTITQILFTTTTDNSNIARSQSLYIHKSIYCQVSYRTLPKSTHSPPVSDPSLDRLLKPVEILCLVPPSTSAPLDD